MAVTENGDAEQTRRPDGRRVTVALHIALQILLAVAGVILLNLLAARLGFVCESGFTATRPVSERTREILTHAQGTVRAVCFFDSGHPLLRPAGRLLCGFKAVAARAGGVAIEMVYVDPRRDLAKAKSLTDAAVPPNAIVFEGQGRRITVLAADLVVTNQSRQAVFRGETVCAAAIARLARGEQPVVYWLRGHGEGDLEDYDPETGFSTLAREIRHEGYELRPLDLWKAKGVPADAAALIVLGPHNALATEEVTWLEACLTHGGRLLYLVNPAKPSGLEGTLERWGVQVTAWTAVSRETMSGHDTVILRYGDLAITRGLTNSATVFLGSRCIQAATTAAEASGADRAKFTALALTGPEGWGARAPEVQTRVFDPHEDLPGPVAVAAAVERGGEAGKDITLQPTRLVVVGEDGFVSNPMLATRSSANRDIFVNALNWLTGIERGTGVSGGGDAALWTGLDRRGWMRFTLFAAGAAPTVVLVLGLLVVARRRAHV